MPAGLLRFHSLVLETKMKIDIKISYPRDMLVGVSGFPSIILNAWTSR